MNIKINQLKIWNLLINFTSILIIVNIELKLVDVLDPRPVNTATAITAKNAIKSGESAENDSWKKKFLLSNLKLV